jgi:hypothetical protein
MKPLTEGKTRGYIKDLPTTKRPMAPPPQGVKMKETRSTNHTFSVTVTNELYKQMKREHGFKTIPGQPTSQASYGVIGKLIEIIEKRYQSVTLNYKGN